MTGPNDAGDVLEVFPDSARILGADLTIGDVAAAELAEEFGTPLVVYCESTLRARARAFRGAVGRWSRRVRDEGVRQRRRSPPPARGGHRGRRRLGRRARLRPRGRIPRRRDRRTRQQQGRGVSPRCGRRRRDGGPRRTRRGRPGGCGRGAARARARHARRRRRHPRGDPHRPPRLEVRPPSGAGARADRGCARPRPGRARASTSTSGRSSQTSTRRRRRSCGSRRSPHRAATSSAGPRASPISAAASASATTSTSARPTRPCWRRARPRRRGPCIRRGRSPVARSLARARTLAGGHGRVTLYRVGAVKRLPERTWVAVDGGMSDNPRPQLYDAVYTALSADRADEPATSGQRRGDALRVGRRTHRRCRAACATPRRPLAVPATGAYTLAMASNYNGVTRPAAVLVAGGEARLIRRRETIRRPTP